VELIETLRNIAVREGFEAGHSIQDILRKQVYQFLNPAGINSSSTAPSYRAAKRVM
jgi:hypothetical protein